MPKPQFPTTTDVTPWKHDDEANGSSVSCGSQCVCGSMKPGATTQPSAESARRAADGANRPIAAIFPSAIATSARRREAPVPSITSPSQTIRSYIARLP